MARISPLILNLISAFLEAASIAPVFFRSASYVALATMFEEVR